VKGEEGAVLRMGAKSGSQISREKLEGSVGKKIMVSNANDRRKGKETPPAEGMIADTPMNTLRRKKTSTPCAKPKTYISSHRP